MFVFLECGFFGKRRRFEWGIGMIVDEKHLMAWVFDLKGFNKRFRS